MESIRDLDRGWKAIKKEITRRLSDDSIDAVIVGIRGGLFAPIGGYHEFGGSKSSVAKLEKTRSFRRMVFVFTRTVRRLLKAKFNRAQIERLGGLGRPPKRSFLRSTMDAKKGVYQLVLSKLAVDIFSLRATKHQSLLKLGALVVSDIRSRIVSGINPPLAASTLRQKGSSKSTPLIYRGRLLRSITHRIE